MATYGSPIRDVGQAFADVSVASLSNEQAAGTTAVIAANPNRTGFAITPNADGRLYFTGPASADGPYFPLYLGVTRTLTGGDCPTGALYVTGQAAASKLRMGEA